jgi:hypothetical protein
VKQTNSIIPRVRISDPTGAGAGVIFHPRVRPTRILQIGGCGRKFHFSPVGDPRISKILDFDGFSPASSPKFPSGSKFWPNLTISHTHIPYRNLRCRSSYSSTSFFFWCSNPPQSRDRIHPVAIPNWQSYNALLI